MTLTLDEYVVLKDAGNRTSDMLSRVMILAAKHPGNVDYPPMLMVLTEMISSLTMLLTERTPITETQLHNLNEYLDDVKSRLPQPPGPNPLMN